LQLHINVDVYIYLGQLVAFIKLNLHTKHESLT